MHWALGIVFAKGVILYTDVTGSCVNAAFKVNSGTVYNVFLADIRLFSRCSTQTHMKRMKDVIYEYIYNIFFLDRLRYECR